MIIQAISKSNQHLKLEMKCEHDKNHEIRVMGPSESDDSEIEYD